MEPDLVVRAQRGDKGAYAIPASAIADRCLAVARRILRDFDLAEDATQQALLTIWRDIPQLRAPARFEAWSYRILVRACYAEGRSVSSHWAARQPASVSPPLPICPEAFTAPPPLKR